MIIKLNDDLQNKYNELTASNSFICDVSELMHVYTKQVIFGEPPFIHLIDSTIGNGNYIKSLNNYNVSWLGWVNNHHLLTKYGIVLHDKKLIQGCENVYYINGTDFVLSMIGNYEDEYIKFTSNLNSPVILYKCSENDNYDVNANATITVNNNTISGNGFVCIFKHLDCLIDISTNIKQPSFFIPKNNIRCYLTKKSLIK